jgi:hypothetical protein
MSNRVLAELPNYTDACGCSLMNGRCDVHAEMMAEIHAVWNSPRANTDAALVIWMYSDGYGAPGFIPEQGYDWSGIRDSSTDAIESMWMAIHA